MDTSCHSGHRERMRNRFFETGSFKGFSDHEVLEMMLFFVIKRGNTNPLAHELINSFGSLRGVFEAGRDQLKQIKGVGDSIADAIEIMGAISKRIYESEEKPVILNSFARISRYLQRLLGKDRYERALLICIDSSCRVCKRIDITDMDTGEVGIDVREALKSAVSSGCSCILLAHNHPDAPAVPSDEDIRFTRRLIAALDPLGMTLLDHCVVGNDGVVSLRKAGFIFEYE